VIPLSTYRVQLHAGFTFDDASAITDYLARLGVSHLYCSPYLQAVPGSTHGYDVVDHRHLNEDLGGEEAYGRLIAALLKEKLGQMLDIVPNHMAVAGRRNAWWWDVLENGPSSQYAPYFDIEWESAEQNRAASVLAPVLGDHYGRVLEAGELAVERQDGSFMVRYYDHEFPLSPRSMDDLLAAAARRAGSEELANLAAAFGRLPHALRTDLEAVAERHRNKEVLRNRLAALCETQPTLVEAIDAELDDLNHDPDALDALLRRQNFRLAFWRIASEELDYRRFFNIETLVGLRVEDPRVFADTHALILELVRKGMVNGLRIDHVDGLRDPEGYLHRLRGETGDIYIVVEKILHPEEELPKTWPVEGTSGYDFLNRVNNLFVDTDNEAALTACYSKFTGQDASYEEVAHGAKLQIMRQELVAEVERLTRLLADICDTHRRYRDYTRRELRDAMREVIAAFDIYRTYVQPGRPVSEADRDHVEKAVAKAAARRPDLDVELFRFIGELLLLQHPGNAETELAVRFQQVSSPVMAKGVEDTTFYRYNRLISLNEVGGDPGLFGRPVEQFHQGNARIAAQWPATMLTLSTHDTKRSADVRARLNVLSEIPEPWEHAVSRWAEHNERYRVDGLPDRNAEYLLYQTLVGAWPVDAKRAGAFMEKAAKEAKVATSWIDPVPAYDEALAGFVQAILSDEEFLADLQGFLTEHRLVELGRVNSLAQTALLLTCPGVPDLYQGSELWDLSLVDPDNRRPVDYGRRRALLEELQDAGPDEALQRSDEGSPKLWLIHRLLVHRRHHPEIYDSITSYEPLAVGGAKARHALGFTRGQLAVIVPRLLVSLAGEWDDTSVTLPEGPWTDVLTRSTFGGNVPINDLLAAFPISVLARDGA
jgi:(1->4)-alpha-D-glucan 1-alpha-D-glucosylmutase